MKQTKKTDVIKYQGLNGKTTPIFYEGKICRIGDKPVELEESKIPYESKIHIKNAIAEKAMEVIKDQGEEKP